MTLDSRFRAAVAETVQASRDLDASLGDLRRTRRSRAIQRSVVLGAVAVVAAAGFVLQRHQPTTPQPAPQPAQLRGGAVLGLGQGGSVTQVAGPALPHRPGTALTTGPFSFTHDGASLVYAVDGGVHRLDLRTGTDDVIGDCPDATCAVAYNEDATRSAIAEGDAIVVTDEATGETTRLPIGAQASRISWSPGSGALSYVTQRGARARLETVDVESGEISTRLRLSPGTPFVATPRWSPDGHEIALVTHQAQPGQSGPIRVAVVTTKLGPLVNYLHTVATCACTDYEAGLAWSPDGATIALTLVGRPDDSGAGGDVQTVCRDGSKWQTMAPGAYTGGLAWQPDVSSP